MVITVIFEYLGEQQIHSEMCLQATAPAERTNKRLWNILLPGSCGLNKRLGGNIKEGGVAGWLKPRPSNLGDPQSSLFSVIPLFFISSSRISCGSAITKILFLDLFSALPTSDDTLWQWDCQRGLACGEPQTAWACHMWKKWKTLK